LHEYELPLLKRSGGGAICNTASVAALTGPGGMCATRLRNMEFTVDASRLNGERREQDSGQHGGPGMDRNADGRCRQCAEPAFAKQAVSTLPARRGGPSERNSAAAVWLCSTEASYVFGQMLVVDGGMTIGGFEL